MFRSTPISKGRRVQLLAHPHHQSPDIIKTWQGRWAKSRAFVRLCLSNGCTNAFRGSHGKWQNPHYRSASSFVIKKRAFETIRGPQIGMLPRLDLQGAQGAFKDSMIHFCNSHYLSQFAAFFIDGRTKRSVAKSCFLDFRRPHYQS